MLLAAVMTPLWLAGEWIVRCEERRWNHGMPPGMLALALIYFTAFRPERGAAQRALFALGAGCVVPGAIIIAALGMRGETARDPAPWTWMGAAWVMAVGLPLAVALGADPRRWSRHVAEAGWVAGLAALAQARWDLAV